MSMSLIAILYYGFPLLEGDRENDVHDEDKEESLHEAEWEDRELASRSVVRPEHRDYKKEEWKVYFAQRKEIVDALPCDVAWVGHTEFGYPVLAIRKAMLTRYSRDDTAIVIPAIDPAWDGQLREWCEKYGFTYGTPSWQLAPRYS